MKVFYICLFFVGMFIFPGVALGQKLFPYDIFEKSIDEFPISETELLCREWEKVSNDSICKYLVQIKNEADYGKRGHSVNYEVFSRYAKGEDLYLFYKKTCPEDSLIEIFVCNWSYENHFPVTLKIYRSKKGVADIFF